MVNRENTTSPEMGREIITADATRQGSVPSKMATLHRSINTQIGPATQGVARSARISMSHPYTNHVLQMCILGPSGPASTL
jgi:hypothetical protein